MEYNTYFCEITINFPQPKKSYRNRGKQNRESKRISPIIFFKKFDETGVRQLFPENEIKKRDLRVHENRLQKY